MLKFPSTKEIGMQSWDSQSSRGEIKDDHREKKKNSNPKEGRRKKEQREKMVKISPNFKSNYNK